MLRFMRILVILFCFMAIFPTNIKANSATDVYIVKPGDSLWKIAVKYEVGLSEIIAANRQIKNPHWIYPGDRITVPLFDETKRVEQQVVDLVNKERAKAGVAPLRTNWEVARVARYKSKEMRDKGYFDHHSPTYGSPFDMLRAFSIRFQTAGENIAAGQQTAASVVESWMNSPGHRNNIMSTQFTQIGVGYTQGGSYGSYWTQMFIHE